MRIRSRWMLAVVAGIVGAVGFAVPASAAGPEPWEPWPQPEFSVPPGKYCDFGFRLEVISQDIERRTLDRYDDDTIRLEEYRGPLVSDFIREDTGDSVRTDSSGRMFVEYYADGTPKVYTTIGPVGAGFTEADDYPRGYYNLDGLHVQTVDPDGIKHMSVDAGEETDVCAQLS